MFELILGKCQQDPDPVFRILISWIRIRPKMDRIHNPASHDWCPITVKWKMKNGRLDSLKLSNYWNHHFWPPPFPSFRWAVPSNFIGVSGYDLHPNLMADADPHH